MLSAALPRLAGRGLVVVYRYTLAPLIGPRCRHLPSCSEYADEAIARFGLWAGGWMALARILRCQPLGTHGARFRAGRFAGGRPLVDAVALRALARAPMKSRRDEQTQRLYSRGDDRAECAGSIFFGLRSYGSYLLLRSAYEAGRPQVSSLRAWMTLDHVAATYRVPLNELIAAPRTAARHQPR